jgi:hypothetical protein
LQVRASRYLESSGVKTPEMRNPEISYGISVRAWPEVMCKREPKEKELCQRLKASALVIENICVASRHQD